MCDNLFLPKKNVCFERNTSTLLFKKIRYGLFNGLYTQRYLINDYLNMFCDIKMVQKEKSAIFVVPPSTSHHNPHYPTLQPIVPNFLFHYRNISILLSQSQILITTTIRHKTIKKKKTANAHNTINIIIIT